MHHLRIIPDEPQMIEITDEMCRRAIDARDGDHIQGFSTPLDAARRKWGAPHWVLNVSLPRGEQELWRGDNYEEMADRCRIEEMRLALRAALAYEQSVTEKT